MRSATRGQRPPGSKERQKGQSLVEFALVFPLFWACLVALIEFAFVFNAVLSISIASRDGAVVAAEAANASTADCSILHSIENDISVPASAKQIQTVDISWTHANGVAYANATTTYTRSSSSSIACLVNGVSYSVPYVLTTNQYPYSVRCATRNGFGCLSGHTGLDTIGVKITYLYTYKTPYGAVLGGPGWTLVRSSAMRVEPYQ